MAVDITIKIAGEAGQGIQTVGDFLSLVCHKAGLYLMAINDFESRIRGGYSFFQIRVSDRPVFAPCPKVNLLVALNQKSCDAYEHELTGDGLIMIDIPDGNSGNRIALPMKALAEKAGGKISANTVAAGACLGLMGAPIGILEEILKDQFGEKSEDVLAMNLSAAKLGFEHVGDIRFSGKFEWKPETPKGILMDGSKAIALGALAGDCRVTAFYPMSPATGIMTYLASLTDDFPLVVEQAEDEIAAVNMVIGASFAGVRAMTATSGGGFCLMTEGIGLAAITETPIVVVNAQRPGPATGLPTRTAQGDLMFVINAAQDEFPRFVLAPGTPAEAFEITARAFHLAEKYQVPVIILADQTLCDSICISEKSLKAPQTIERFITDDSRMESPSEYNRYAVNPSGISPRALPCNGKALVLASGNEHEEDGHISEAISDRILMVDKRKAKLPAMLSEMGSPEIDHEKSEILLVGWGSGKGPIQEAAGLLRKEGLSVGSVHMTDLWPFPADAVTRILETCKRFFVVEGNSTAQLGRLIREQTGMAHHGAVLKYDGRPFFPDEIAEGVRKYL
ncbi:MAG: 2-oxoacid:acceptor oxidoreductase subunit alpha [Desulfobacteraceae bacterium]|nr:MAG: 2-oxoacid:acceptor oxidoreductase subunit alpha [Desulfobacteraceae bacterium]